MGMEERRKERELRGGRGEKRTGGIRKGEGRVRGREVKDGRDGWPLL